MTTGMIRPSWSLPEVFALNALQNSMMFTPCGPSAVPTGGAGVAAPAWSCSLTSAAIFFLGGIPSSLSRGHDEGRTSALCHLGVSRTIVRRCGCCAKSTALDLDTRRVPADPEIGLL